MSRSSAKQPLENWDDVSGTLQTGDVILFHSPDLVSEAIDVVTDARYSHVAMVVRDLPGAPSSPLALWQAFEPEGGVVIDGLPDFLHTYHHDDRGSFACRHLEMERTPAMEEKLLEFIEKVKGRPFPTVTGMVTHYIEGRLRIDSGERSFFCSNLVADTWQHMGIIDHSSPANGYAPADFAARTRFPFLVAATFGELIRFKADP